MRIRWIKRIRISVPSLYRRSSVLFLLSIKLRLKPSRQYVHNSLVSRHHNCGIRNLSDQLRGQTPIHAAQALLPEHQPQRLPEAGVFGALLPQPSSRHLVRVCYARGDRFRYRARHHELQKVFGTLCVGVAHPVRH